MKRIQKLLMAFSMFCLAHLTLYAQDTNQLADFINQGNKLAGQKKYDDAIAMYNEALKIDPANANASYELAYALFSSNKSDAAIPYLQKVTQSDHKGLVVAAYSMMGTIYDQGHQPQKAVEAFNQGIKLGPNYPQIYYNLGLAYFRNNQYAEAETVGIEAMKHDPKNAANQRLYALVCFHQNKRGYALLGFCSYLLADQNAHTGEALTNIQSILKGGVLKQANGQTAASIKSTDSEVIALNNAINAAVSGGQAKKLTGEALLEFQLNSIITTAGQLAEKKTDKIFFDKFFADYLYKLVQSGNLPTFTRTASLSAYHDENAKWLKENPEKLRDLAEWITKTERGF